MVIEDDQYFLEAYLDDELDTPARAAVDRAIEANPALASRLRELAALRESISSLPRPACPAELGGLVLARAASEARARSARLGWLTSAGVGMAAACLVITRLAPVIPMTAPPVQLAHQRTHSAPVVQPVEMPAPILAAQPGPAVQPEALKTLAAATSTEADLAEDRDRTWSRDLLDRPDVRCIYVTVDRSDSTADRRVDSLVQAQPRTYPQYADWTVSQGIAIDPAHPGEARVFIVVATRAEMHRLQANLIDAFPGRVEEPAEPDPAVLTQLADVGRITVVGGTQATPVHQPIARFALRRSAADDRSHDVVVGASAAVREAPAAAERGGSNTPKPSIIADAEAAAREEEMRPFTLVVWVAPGRVNGRSREIHRAGVRVEVGISQVQRAR